MAFRGHAMPMFELAEELLRRGHDVRVAVQEEGIPWYADHRCAASNGTSSCCRGPAYCPRGSLVSLGRLSHTHSAVRKHLYSVVDDSALLHGIWGVLRDLYMGQATRTASRLCRYLSAALPAKDVDCDIKDPFGAVHDARDEDGDLGAYDQRARVKAAVGNPDRWVPDVIVADVGALGAAEIADLFQIPVVLNSPTLFFSFGDPNQSASRHLPGWGSGFSRHMGFLDRCINVVYPRLMAIALTPDFVLLNQLLENMGLPPRNAQHTIFQGRHMLVDTVIGFEYPRFLEPTVHFVGVLQRPVYTGPPPPSAHRHYLVTQKWLDAHEAAGRSVVAVALGSIGIVSPDLLASFLEGMRSHAVLWVVSSELDRDPIGSVEINARNLLTYVASVRPRRAQDASSARDATQHDLVASFIEFCKRTSPFDADVDEEDEDAEHFRQSWRARLCPVSKAGVADAEIVAPDQLLVHEQTDYLPLTELLSHRAIEATFSYCGLSIAQESIRAETPLVCLPLFADQFDVAARVVDLGVGSVIHRDSTSTRADVERALRRKYAPHVLGRASRLFQHLDGRQIAGDLIEYVARGPPEELLHTKSETWPFFRSLNYDIIAFVISAIVFCTSASLALLKGVYRGFGFDRVPHEPGPDRPKRPPRRRQL